MVTNFTLNSPPQSTGGARFIYHCSCLRRHTEGHTRKLYVAQSKDMAAVRMAVINPLVQISDLSPAPRLPGSTRSYHAMIKPVGAICNIDCTYCYYLHKEELLGSTSKFQISDEILETHIRQYIEGQDREEVVFSWQGGEPTLLGLEFFEKVVDLEQKYKKPGQRIENDLQTNGTLLNDDWGAFLKQQQVSGWIKHRWARKNCMTPYRVTKDGKPTFKKVFAASQMLHRYGVPFNSLSVINRVNARKPLDVYRFLKNEVRPRQMQFIPGLEPKVFRNVAPQMWDQATLPLFDSRRRASRHVPTPS